MRRSTRPRCAGWARWSSSRSATGCTGPRKAAAAGRAAAAATAAAGDEPTHLRGERSTMSERVREILSWYGSDNPGTLANLARLMNHGRLAGTGRFVILPVDQGFEHGPARSFAPNAPGYDPRYHFELALAAGCNAYAAPLGFLEAGAAELAGELPLISSVSDPDTLYRGHDPRAPTDPRVGG